MLVYYLISSETESYLNDFKLIFLLLQKTRNDRYSKLKYIPFIYSIQPVVHLSVGSSVCLFVRLSLFAFIWVGWGFSFSIFLPLSGINNFEFKFESKKQNQIQNRTQNLNWISVLYYCGCVWMNVRRFVKDWAVMT